MAFSLIKLPLLNAPAYRTRSGQLSDDYGDVLDLDGTTDYGWSEVPTGAQSLVTPAASSGSSGSFMDWLSSPQAAGILQNAAQTGLNLVQGQHNLPQTQLPGVRVVKPSVGNSLTKALESPLTLALIAGAAAFIFLRRK